MHARSGDESSLGGWTGLGYLSKCRAHGMYTDFEFGAWASRVVVFLVQGLRNRVSGS